MVLEWVKYNLKCHLKRRKKIAKIKEIEAQIRVTANTVKLRNCWLVWTNRSFVYIIVFDAKTDDGINLKSNRYEETIKFFIRFCPKDEKFVHDKSIFCEQ